LFRSPAIFAWIAFGSLFRSHDLYLFVQTLVFPLQTRWFSTRGERSSTHPFPLLPVLVTFPRRTCPVASHPLQSMSWRTHPSPQGSWRPAFRAFLSTFLIVISSCPGSDFLCLPYPLRVRYFDDPHKRPQPQLLSPPVLFFCGEFPPNMGCDDQSVNRQQCPFSHTSTFRREPQPHFQFRSPFFFLGPFMFPESSPLAKRLLAEDHCAPLNSIIFPSKESLPSLFKEPALPLLSTMPTLNCFIRYFSK